MNKEHASFAALIIMAFAVSFIIFITNYEEVGGLSLPFDVSFELPEFEYNRTISVPEIESEAPASAPQPPTPEEEAAEEEPAPDYEFDFINGARYLNMSHNYGLFETKLIRVGWYQNPEEGIDEIRFRADIWVKYIGTNGTEDFKEENAFIRQIPDIRYNDTISRFDGDNIAPGEERSGYILFDDVPYNISGEIDLIIGTSRAYSSIFGIQMHSPHMYRVAL